MIDIKFLVKNPDVVRENIKKKFQDNKLPLVDEAINLYTQYCDCQQRADDLRSQRNSISKEIGILFKNKEVEKANEMKKLGIKEDVKHPLPATEEEELQPTKPD